MAEKKENLKSDIEDAFDTVKDSENDNTADSAEESSKKDKKAELKKLKSEIEDLKRKFSESEKIAGETNDKYLRLAAEYDNFRKRSQKERDNIYGDAVADTLAGLLPIIDNLQYASKYTSGDSEKFAEGVNLILSKLPETLEKMEVKAFGEVGEKFDPSLHNAVLHVEDDSYEEGVITDVLQCGYMYREKVLRYAMVKVAN